MRIIHFMLVFLFLISPILLLSQEDLMDLFEDEKETTEYEYATFKTTRVCLGHSVTIPYKKELVLIFSHHFGEMSFGDNRFLGLDQASTRIGAEYSIFENLCIGIGRSSYQKAYDGFVKARLLRQSQGAKNMPVTLVYLGATSVNTLEWSEPERENYFSSRFSYAHQLILARKFSPSFSLQFIPSLVHNNLVALKTDKNSMFAMGVSGRVKITNRVSVNGEYYYLLPDQKNPEPDNSLTLGFDIETGGHIFQLFFTNSMPLTEKGFISETNGTWLDGNIRFGLNITRLFSFRAKPE